MSSVYIHLCHPSKITKKCESGLHSVFPPFVTHSGPEIFKFSRALGVIRSIWCLWTLKRVVKVTWQHGHLEKGLSPLQLTEEAVVGELVDFLKFKPRLLGVVMSELSRIAFWAWNFQIQPASLTQQTWRLRFRLELAAVAWQVRSGNSKRPRHPSFALHPSAYQGPPRGVTCDVLRVTFVVWRVTVDVWRVMCDVCKTHRQPWRRRASKLPPKCRWLPRPAIALGECPSRARGCKQRPTKR